MSLRVFHIVFIVASILLSALTAAWSIRHFAIAGGAQWLVMAVLFLGCGAALVAYAGRAFRKLRELAE